MFVGCIIVSKTKVDMIRQSGKALGQCVPLRWHVEMKDKTVRKMCWGFWG